MPNRRDVLIGRVTREKLPPLAGPASTRFQEPDRLGLFGEAVAWYSRVRPRRAFATIPGDGTAFDFLLPDGQLYNGVAAWQAGASRVTAVEYPVGPRQPVYLTEDDYLLV